MAGPQWENLPEPRQERPVPSLRSGWQGFTVDPRPPANQGLRAADADRDYAVRLVEQARLDGRLASARPRIAPRRHRVHGPSASCCRSSAT